VTTLPQWPFGVATVEVFFGHEKETDMRLRLVLIAGAFVAMQSVSFAQQSLSHRPPSPKEAEVGFGIFPVGPIDTSPLCLVEGAGGPTDPCAYKIHKLVPEETTIRWGGEVTFHVHGGGHAIAIYAVSGRTKREDIGEFLCAVNPGIDPATIEDPLDHVCNAATPQGTGPGQGQGQANAALDHKIRDARGDVVIVSGPGGPTHPNNRVWYTPGRLFSAGGHQFLTGVGAGVTPTTGQLITYRFLVPGRYLVICMNRSHFLNDWMFGFVHVELL
jgi:hypothetical protein